MLNKLPLESAGKRPRGICLVNGEEVRFIDFEVNNNGFYQADTFNVTIPLLGNRPGYDLNFYSRQPAILVELYAGFPANPEKFTKNELKLWITGAVEDDDTDLNNLSITFHGRDLTSKFIDAKTTEKFPNQTASQIATTLANRRELKPVITQTSTKVGTYYQDEHVLLTSQISEWDLLTFLARKEGFAVYVVGTELHFEPKPTVDANPYVIQYQYPDLKTSTAQSNAITIKPSRNHTLSKDIIVKVRGFNPKTKKGYTKTAKATHTKNSVLSGKAQPIGNAQTYVYRKNSLTPEQALQFAQQKLKELSSHEMKVEITLPGDDILTPRNVIQLTGTQSAFDQFYFPDSITRALRADSDTGYSMTVHAKNHAPDSEVVV